VSIRFLWAMASDKKTSANNQSLNL